MTFFHDGLIGRRVTIDKLAGVEMAGRTGIIRGIQYSESASNTSAFLIEMEDGHLIGIIFQHVVFEPKGV